MPGRANIDVVIVIFLKINFFSGCLQVARFCECDVYDLARDKRAFLLGGNDRGAEGWYIY
jgi:hypothetical protein